MDYNPSSTTGNSPVTPVASNVRPNRDAVIATLGPNGEIATSLVAVYNQTVRRAFCFIGIPIFFLFVLGIILLIIFIGTENLNRTVVIILSLACLFVLMIFLILYWVGRVDSLGRTEHYAIRIEGDQWVRYLAHWLYKNDRHIKSSYCCIDIEKRINELRSRGFGYVIIGRNGFMIDELFCIRYIALIIHNVEILTNVDQSGAQDTMLHVQYYYRWYESQFSRSAFHADIFIPPQIPKNELRKIRNFMMGKPADSSDSEFPEV